MTGDRWAWLAVGIVALVIFWVMVAGRAAEREQEQQEQREQLQYRWDNEQRNLEWRMEERLYKLEQCQRQQNDKYGLNLGC